MVDKVKPLKYENSVDGTEEDNFPTQTDPSEDYLATKGVSFENSNDHLIDRNVSGEIQVKDSFFVTPISIRAIKELLDVHAGQHLPNGTDALATAIAETLSALSNNTVGSANSFSRSDHTHNITTGNVSTQTPDQTNNEGSGGALARADHVHNIPTAQPVTSLTSSTNTQGSANTFAKSDHVHKIEIPVFIARTNNQVTANNGTDQLLDSMTVTPPAGTYLVSASAISSNNNRNADCFFSIYVGGTQIADTEEAIENNSSNNQTNTFHTYITEAEVTVNGSQAIEIRVRTTAGNTTYYLRTLRAMRIS